MILTKDGKVLTSDSKVLTTSPSEAKLVANGTPSDSTKQVFEIRNMQIIAN